MVKFGKHIEGFVANEKDAARYVLAYNEVKALISADRADWAAFEPAWTKALRAATDDFDRELKAAWDEVFDGISDLPEGEEADDHARGAPPDVAVQLFAKYQGRAKAAELLAGIKALHAAAVNNADGLRKLVKKFDKYCPDSVPKLSRTHLPKIYCANFTLGLPLLEEYMDFLRAMLEDKRGEVCVEEEKTEGPTLDEDEPFRDSVTDMDAEKKVEKAAAADEVAGRRAQFNWLSRLAESLTSDELNRLVAHRGFHHICDRQDDRPLENSLEAYETAWTNGIRLCECDIALTRDEKLVLAHDADFSRLALDSKKSITKQNVTDITFKQLMSLPLKSGSRPPLLLDVLRSAHMIGPEAKLIIEVKPGNTAAASALALLLIRYPDLIQNVGMIMSFDLFTMHLLRREIEHLRHQRHFPDGMGMTMPTTIQRASTVQRTAQFKSFDRYSSTDRFDLGVSKKFPLAGVNEVESMETLHFPKLMLLTVSDPPQPGIPELQLKSEDFSSLKSWLVEEDGALDGVYLQYEEEMATAERAAALKELSKEFAVGVWTYPKDPDNYDSFNWLVKEGGLTYVNTDLPEAFRKSVPI